jgi:hypothetical protein
MAYNIENATYNDYRMEEFKNLTGHAWVKFDEVNGAGESFYITDTLAGVNDSGTLYLGRCNSIAELETLAEAWAND